MPRQDGRIEQGQSLKSAISARAWNRAQDAADLVLADRYGINANGLTTARLPGVRAKLAGPGYFGEAKILNGPAASFGLAFTDVTPHADPQNTLENFSDDEKKLVSFVFPPFLTQQFAAEGRIVVCCGNSSHDYVISGLAITRVRVFNYNHRYARWPREFPGQTHEQSALALGALDSAFYGPVQVLGYWSASGGFYRSTAQFKPLVYPAFEMRWALVHI